MPRIRTIKPEFWTSEKLATRLPGPDGRQARLLFIGLWNLAEDRTGVARGHPVYLKASLFPYDEDVTARDVDRWLELLAQGGFVVRYQRDGASYLWVRGFTEHQRIERPSKPTLPEPSADEIRHPTEPSPSPHRALTEDSSTEGKGKEGKVEEGSPAAPGLTEPSPPPHRQPAQEPLLDLPPPVRAPRSERARARESTGDPRHRPLVEALCAAAPEYTFRGGTDAKAVERLLALADAKPETAGEAAPAEVLRRWGIGRAWRWGNGEAPVQCLTSLASRWNECRSTETAPPAGAARRAPGGPQTHVRAGDMQHSEMGGVNDNF